jgi:hypothetical protein
MKVQSLQAALRKQPFMRFELRAGGETILVQHPEQVFLTMDKEIAIIDVGDRIRVIDVDQINKLAFVLSLNKQE